jgi:hypothetical protein
MKTLEMPPDETVTTEQESGIDLAEIDELSN